MKNSITKCLLWICIGLFVIGLAPTVKTHAACSHKWGLYVVRQATCTTSGIKTRKCVKCGVVAESISIPATGHNYSASVIEIQPTCVQEGVKRTTCTRCGASITSKMVPRGHDFRPATCTSPQMCKRCGVTTGVPAGHRWTAWIIEQEATGTVAQTAYRRCTVCGLVQRR